jgi:hypothetical protein
MSGLELRPRFKIESELPPDELIQKICSKIKDEEAPCDGSVVTNHAVLRVPQKEAHFWSPQLSLDISDHEKGSEIRGLFGPSPGVWTMFVFFYMGIGITGLFGFFYGMAQWTLDKNPHALWSLPIAIILEFIVYFIAQAGKKLGNKQMQQLNSILKRVLGE